MFFNTIFVAMKETINKIDELLTQLHKVRVDLIFNGKVTLEDKELVDGDTIKVALIKYQTDEHYQYCIDINDHSTATDVNIEIDLSDFNDWIKANDLEIESTDAYNHLTGHYIIKGVLEFEDYFTDENVLNYIKEYNRLKIEL